MIHAESLILWNAALCACALPLGGRLAGLPNPPRRSWQLAAAMSGLSAVMCITPLPALSLASLPGSVALCFCRHGFSACARCTLTTLLASFLLGGAATALHSAGLPMCVSAAGAAMLGLGACLFISLLPAVMEEIRQVEVQVEDRAILLPAMLDSGNLLRDPLTGQGVLVVPRTAAETLFPGIEDVHDLTTLPLGFRLLNVRTAAGSALLPMFRPDLCRIYLDGRSCDAQLLVAVAGRDYSGVQALVPMAALASFSKGGCV